MLFEIKSIGDNNLSLVLDKITDANESQQIVPAYHFFIYNENNEKVGVCDLRVGYNDKLYYGGHIGYMIFKEHRGHHYAAKAVSLLKYIALKNNMEYIYITCNPDNMASRRTCEIAGGQLYVRAMLPEGNDMREKKGETEKFIYKFYLR